MINLQQHNITKWVVQTSKVYWDILRWKPSRPTGREGTIISYIILRQWRYRAARKCFIGNLISLHLSRMTGSSYSHLLHSLYVKYYGVENVVRVSKWCRNENAHVMCSLTSSGQVGYHLRRTPSFEYRSLEGVKNMLDSRQNVPPSQTQAASADTIIKKRRALYCFGRCDLIYTLGRHWKHSPCCSGGLHTS